MSLKKEPETKSFSPQQSNEMRNFWNNAFNGDNKKESDNDIKDLETIKLILSSIMDDRNLESLSSLTKGQIDDINDAFILFEIFEDPLILNFIMHRLQLNRSLTTEPKNLLSIFSDIAGKATGFIDDSLNGSILGKRFG